MNTVDRTIAKTRVTYDKQYFKLKIVFKSIINHRVSNFLTNLMYLNNLITKSI